MAHPIAHATSSARQFGGVATDYLAIHNWFDESKAYVSDWRHRAMRHHSEGIFLCEKIFGVTIRNSAGRDVPVRYIGEQHVKEDLGRVPTAQEWFSNLRPQPWMRGRRLQSNGTQSKPTATSIDALKALISTVQATGGLVRFPDGSYGCAADEEWLDLADAVLVAKQVLENETGVVVELTITEMPPNS